MKNCPACQSDQIKKASLIHAEGVSNSRAVGVGLGTGHVAGVGVGVGSSATALASQCAPPKRGNAPFVGGVFSLFIGCVITALGLPNYLGYYVGLVLLPGLAIVPFIAYKQSKANKAKYELALSEYEKIYMCLRCGHFYKPFS